MEGTKDALGYGQLDWYEFEVFFRDPEHDAPDLPPANATDDQFRAWADAYTKWKADFDATKEAFRRAGDRASRQAQAQAGGTSSPTGSGARPGGMGGEELIPDPRQTGGANPRKPGPNQKPPAQPHGLTSLTTPDQPRRNPLMAGLAAQLFQQIRQQSNYYGDGAPKTTWEDGSSKTPHNGDYAGQPVSVDPQRAAEQVQTRHNQEDGMNFDANLPKAQAQAQVMNPGSGTSGGGGTNKRI
jgi:hypothetical protein